MRHEVTRDTLINATIQVFARDGIDKATTKNLAAEAGLNEVYIYRTFEDKEDLYVKTFEKLDNELVSELLEHLPVMSMKGVSFEDRCWIFFSFVWRFILFNRKKAVAFIRYYYSPYFKKYSSDAHVMRYKPVLEQFSVAFKSDANTWLILTHILNTMLDFAIKVIEGEAPDNDDTAEHVFRLVYASTKQYFKD